jgi:hypothetical protein
MGFMPEKENLLKRSDPFDEEVTVLSASSALSLEENRRLEELWKYNHKRSSRKVEQKDESNDQVQVSTQGSGKLPKRRIALLLSYAGTGYQGMQL